MRFIIRILITAAALWAAVWFVPGIEETGAWWNLLWVALVFGVINALVRPVLFTLTCPLIVLTLGLFVFVLNGLLLWLTAAVSDALGIGFHVAGFWAAFIGAFVVSVISTVLNLFVGRPLTRG